MQKQKWFYSKIITTTFLVLTLGSTSQSFAQQYYKWVDHQGSTHYTETPPPKNAKNKTTITTYGHHVSPSAPSTAPVTPQTSQNHVELAKPTNTPKIDQQNEANAALESGQARPQ